ncbi:MAG: succinate dehydrogenase cytochrome b subunit [Planctomycetaceae bacterium]
MKRLLRACSTTVGKKFVMAITGLLLCGFLVVHLAGNLLLYVGAEKYNAYARTLHSQEWLVKIAEVGLIGLFGLHLSLAFQLARENRAARKTGYRIKESKIADRLGLVKPETFMLVSGLVVLAFLALHLVDFTFELRPDVGYDGTPAKKAGDILTSPLSRFGYVIGCALLGLHVAHGFSSAFQSLGWNHPQYERLIHWVGVIVSVAIGVGFLSFPIVYFFQR